MGGRKDEVGNVYGKLTVTHHNENKDCPPDKRAHWECSCECGNTVVVSGSSLRGGKTLSCGCYHKQRIQESHTLHGMSKSPIYKVWSKMQQRCNNVLDRGYNNYGGRGITVCDRWSEPSPKGFLNFLEDMGEIPDGMTLDRQDNNLGYSKENCRWASMSVQNYNKRSTRNASGKTGVDWLERDKMWRVRICKDYKKIWIGTYPSFEDAVRAREEAEIKYFGELRGN